METVRDVPSVDAALVARVAAGDEHAHAALRELYVRHAPWLLVRLSGRCSDQGVVDEALQDTFVAVWRRADSYRGQGEVAAWLWGIAVRRLVDLLRRRPRPSLSFVHEDHSSALRTVESAEEQVLHGVEYGDLAGALRRLSPELRAVVQATVLDGLTTKEASRLLGIPRGTVKSRMARARTELREALT